MKTKMKRRVTALCLTLILFILSILVNFSVSFLACFDLRRSNKVPSSHRRHATERLRAKPRRATRR